MRPCPLIAATLLAACAVGAHAQTTGAVSADELVFTRHGRSPRAPASSFDYAVEPEIVDGLKALGLDPKDIKYVLISHAHGDHDQGAAMLQSRYGAKVVMGAADWESTLQRPASAARGLEPATKRADGRREGG